MAFLPKSNPLSDEQAQKERALKLLEMVGMSHRMNSKMSQLSGGEQQRVAIAIALANKPKLLLADEPTGSVDRKTADFILDLFRHLNKEFGQTVVIVTHDVTLSKKVARVVAIRDGKISSERILKEQYFAENVEEGKVNWLNEETQDEYIVIDRSGRIQIPQEMLEKYGIDGNKVMAMPEKDGILIKKP
jgi:ABC-type methionine transport system ATPase subunit